MTITRRAELDMIGFDVGNDPVTQGQIDLRWRKLTYDGDRLIATGYHRALVDVDTDLDALLEAVALDLEGQGYDRPPATDRAYIDANANLAWSPEVRAAVTADRERRRQDDEAEGATAEAERRAAADAEQQRVDAAVDKAMDRMARNILFDGKGK